MPVLGNPLNQIGWSDLVSKDLMDKFHNFMAHTYVTLGQVKGRTLLPLPPQDVTSSEKTSSKDKAHILESKFHQTLPPFDLLTAISTFFLDLKNPAFSRSLKPY